MTAGPRRRHWRDVALKRVLPALLCACALSASPDSGAARAATALAPPREDAVESNARAPTPAEQKLWEPADRADFERADFVAAAAGYAACLRAHPRGFWAPFARERLDYLERHRPQWELLRRFRLLAPAALTSPAESVADAHRLLAEAGRTPLADEVREWLAAQLASQDRVDEALRVLDLHLGPEGLPPGASAARTRGLTLYANLLESQGRRREALERLAEAEAGSAVSQDSIALARERIRGRLLRQLGAGVAGAILLTALACGLALRPWRRPEWRRHGRATLMLTGGVLAATALPGLAAWALAPQRHGDAFVCLSAGGLAVVWLLRLLAPVSARAGRATFAVLALVLVCCALYLGFHFTDTLEVLERPFEWEG